VRGIVGSGEPTHDTVRGIVGSGEPTHDGDVRQQGPVGSGEPTHDTVRGIVGSGEPTHDTVRGIVGSGEPTHDGDVRQQGPVGSGEPTHDTVRGIVGSGEPTHDGDVRQRGPVGSGEPTHDTMRGGGPTGGERRTIEFTRRRRHLPHWEEPGATYFVRFRLLRQVVDLTGADIAPLVIEGLRFPDGVRYWLYDYTVMPDHAHAILKPVVRDGTTEPLGDIMGSVKKWTARRINSRIGRRGPLWQDETYNHIIQSRAEYAAWAEYILQNPHVAGLIGEATEWPWWGKGSGP